MRNDGVSVLRYFLLFYSLKLDFSVEIGVEKQLNLYMTVLNLNYRGRGDEQTR